MKKASVVILVSVIGISAAFLIYKKSTHSIPVIETISANSTVYVDDAGDFSIEIPIVGWTKKESAGLVVKGQDGESGTIVVEKGSIVIDGDSVLSKVPYEEISKNSPFISYSSCCSGFRYWYDTNLKKWFAETFETDSSNVEKGDLPEEKRKALQLNVMGVCSIREMFGTNVYYKLAANDEGMPSVYHYYFPTNKGYLIDIISFTDAKEAGASYPISKVLSSLSLSGTAEAIPSECI